MIIAVHQPNYLPYPGFFKKMDQCDLFVIYDDAQFNRRDFQHRNRIKTFQGWKWLTVPVEKKSIPINEIRIKNELNKKDMRWQDVHFSEINRNYKDTQYFHIYKDKIKDIYDQTYTKLIDLNLSLINSLSHAFNIKTKTILSSELGLNSKSTQRLVDIIRVLDGDTYLSGPIGDEYQDIQLFDNNGINVIYQDFTYPTYKQLYGEFILNLSAIDVLFNAGVLRA